MEPNALRAIAADVAAAVLLLVLFGFELVWIVVLYSVWRGLGAARRALPDRLIGADAGVRRLTGSARHATAATLRPHIAAVSAWAGVRAAGRMLLARRDDRD